MDLMYCLAMIPCSVRMRYVGQIVVHIANNGMSLHVVLSLIELWEMINMRKRNSDMLTTLHFCNPHLMDSLNGDVMLVNDLTVECESENNRNALCVDGQFANS